MVFPDLEAQYTHMYRRPRWYHTSAGRFLAATMGQTVAAVGGAGYWMYKSATGK